MIFGSFAIFITKNVNLCLNKEELPEILKTAEVTPNYKKTIMFEKDNYRPISNCPILQKFLRELCIIK